MVFASFKVKWRDLQLENLFRCCRPHKWSILTLQFSIMAPRFVKLVFLSLLTRGTLDPQWENPGKTPCCSVNKPMSCFTVEEPCQLGCSGLQYCTMMNNRPMEHFRSCNADADDAAMKDIEMWQGGLISLPGINIHVKGQLKLHFKITFVRYSF